MECRRANAAFPELFVRVYTRVQPVIYNRLCSLSYRIAGLSHRKYRTNCRQYRTL